MAIDYALYDVKESFNVDEAARLWCEADKITEDNRDCVAMIRNEIIRAVADRDIDVEPGQIYYKGNKYWGTPPRSELDYESTIIPRDKLRAWAEKRDQKPKFLFPEMRDEKRILKEEARAVKDQEIDKACVQAVARTLRDIYPNITSEDLSEHKAVKYYANGVHWQKPTIKSWIREIDERPKDKRAGRPRKNAAKNIQPEYADVEK